MGTTVDSEFIETQIFTNIPLSQPFRQALVSRLWPGTFLDEADDTSLQAYLSQTQREFTIGFAGHHAVETFSDLFLILELIRSDTSMCLAELRQNILDRRPKLALATASQLSTSIELAVRLWLMVSVKITMPSHRRLLEASLPWPDNLSLLEVFQRHLTQPSITQTPGIGIFSEYLNVVDMKKIANIRVLWTNNLGEHLAMQGQTLYIFQHVAAIRQLMASPSSDLFLPHPLIKETLTTLNLLIPHDSPASNTWLRSEISTYELDPELLYRAIPASRNKADFIFWHDRMDALSEYFDRTKPTSILQWWHDRRDMGLWWNYWLIVVTIALALFFGLVQSVTGLVQVFQNAASS
ncbi:hypothetical protein V8F33_000837 [Rhypophila sp. PSN 637]